jgi:hypothetical protein
MLRRSRACSTRLCPTHSLAVTARLNGFHNGRLSPNRPGAVSSNPRGASSIPLHTKSIGIIADAPALGFDRRATAVRSERRWSRRLARAPRQIPDSWGRRAVGALSIGRPNPHALETLLASQPFGCGSRQLKLRLYPMEPLPQGKATVSLTRPAVLTKEALLLPQQQPAGNG